MDKNFTHIDDVFKNAFQNAEAPHSPAEMHADWNAVAHQIPATPPQHAPVQHVANHFMGGMGKIIGLSSLGAAVITTAVILYNIYVKQPETKPVAQNNAAQTETSINTQPNSQNNAAAANSGTTNGGSPVNGESDTKNTSGNNAHPATGPRAVHKDIQITPAPKLANPPAIPGMGNPGPVKSNPAPVTPISQNQPIKLVLSETAVCAGHEIAVTVNNQGASMLMNWGDGLFSYVNAGEPNTTVTHIYAKPGKFGINASGDIGEGALMVTIADKPRARFNWHLAPDLHAIFDNTSSSGNRFVWNFGDGSPEEYGYAPNHAFADSGRFVVRLTVFNAGGCPDSFSQSVVIRDFAAPVPSTNVITPNGDGKNDDFYVGIHDETSYTLTIVDRFGNILFQSDNKNQHWDGKNKAGVLCPEGTYYYTVSYSFRQNSEPHLLRGSVSIQLHK